MAIRAIMLMSGTLLVGAVSATASQASGDAAHADVLSASRMTPEHPFEVFTALEVAGPKLALTPS